MGAHLELSADAGLGVGECIQVGLLDKVVDWEPSRRTPGHMQKLKRSRSREWLSKLT